MPTLLPSRRAAWRLAAIAGALAAAVVAAGAPPVRAQAPGGSPARAAVYVRLLGDLEIVRPADAFAPERRIERTNVELSTGSGAFISPVGHVLTAAHVVTTDNGTMTLNGVRVQVNQTPRRIEVLLPPDESGGPVPAPLVAAIVASDQALDVAVLTVSGFNLPFLDLGDSDALVVGDQVEAVGFPFGDQVEIGRPATDATTAPSPSISRGNVSAVRPDERGDRRYVQVTAALNPGNSGGPLVDAEGYLVAVANSVMRSRAGVGAGVGFGVPVNLVKRFLELNGLDSALRARRLAAGTVTTLEGKGLRVALPIGMSDTSPLRARVDTGSHPDGVAFRVDRVVSPWPLARIEAALASARAFEPLVNTGTPFSQASQTAAGRVLIGRVNGALGPPSEDGGSAAADTPVRIEYLIAERGNEKVVARFIGPPYQLAYNASVIRSALHQIEVDPLRAPTRVPAATVTWGARTTPRGTPLDRVPVPSAWTADPVGPLTCQGLPPLADAFSVSPAADFAVSLRAGWSRGAAVSPQAAAAACGTARTADDTAYTGQFAFLGTQYVVEGRFAATDGEGLLQLEWIAPAEQAAAMRAIFAAWPVKQPGTLVQEPRAGSTTRPESRSR